MPNVPPQPIPFLDPLLAYISSSLPPPVYNALLILIGHGLAFFGALIGLGSALISSKPSDWDAQKIVPPLITLLAAYLALASAVRTATWFIRTTTWLIKWGIITAAASAAAAWLFAEGQDATGTTRSSRQRTKQRPQAWESFDQHWEWQFEEQQWNSADTISPSQHVQRFVANALGRAREGNWLSIARSAVESLSGPGETAAAGSDPHEDHVNSREGERAQ
ncbi:hypothetical protein B0F90DRAFT_1817346 [Multifurca ochricompacta]|uniref:Uncharacterized protein n=1 Tax=Multifurca ochricompacta TaxID=376703 RepID=A0AAD4M3T0_9AGAM|nr:hypothetical protein B0F90DRAFT_1817346 [Multifurca ochricompacta]